MVKTDFMDRIKSEMDRIGIPNIRQLSLATGIHQNTFQRHRDKDFFPQTKDVIKLAEFFGRSVDWIVLGQDSESLSPEIQRLIIYAQQMEGDSLRFITDFVQSSVEKNRVS